MYPTTYQLIVAIRKWLGITSKWKDIKSKKKVVKKKAKKIGKGGGSNSDILI